MQSQYTLLLRIESVSWRESQRPCCPSPHLMMGTEGQADEVRTPGPSPVAESGQDFKVFSSLLPLQKALKVKHGDDPQRCTTR